MLAACVRRCVPVRRCVRQCVRVHPASPSPALGRHYAAAPTLLELVKQLRKETSAGVADCRAALVEAELDMERAKALLQESARKTALKKATRQALEGGVLARVEGTHTHALLLELNCETDFAAKDASFLGVMHDISRALHAHSEAGSSTVDVASVLALPYSAESVAGVAVPSVGEAIEQLTYTLRENVQLRRVCALTVRSDLERVYAKVHAPLDGSVGRVGTAVQIRVSAALNEKQWAKVDSFATQLVLHVLAWKPRVVRVEDLPPPAAPSEEGEEAEEEEIEPVLLNQSFLFDDKKTVAQVLSRFGKERLNGVEIYVERFERWEVGEGQERMENDIAADVKKMLIDRL